MHQDYDHLFKLLLAGDSTVGKSSIILRFSDGAFSQQFYSTIGVDFKIKTLDVGGSTIKLQIWDTAGQERFRTIITSYYKGAHGIILVYDITNRESFANIQEWVREVGKHGKKDAIRFLVGNKLDLQDKRKVNVEEGMALAQSLGVNFLEVSSKEQTNIEEVFTILANDLKKKIESQPAPA